MRARILAGVLLLTASSVLAQAPHEEWRTLTTEHYRIHYPESYEEWARHAAGKLDEVRSMVVPLVGYEPPEITDVIVADPLALPNGSAWPFIGSPRMVLWASPPGPGGMLSHQSDWAEIVAIHEDAHLVHLLRPTRNPFRALGWYLLPVRLGPVSGAPRWAVEGYATVIEGQLTGKGRPHSDLRASILRRWAEDGRLPSYGRLASDSSTWLGQSMAYLVGSAYLEWLLEREGSDSLQAVWARLTAKHHRTFDEAFAGVYGDSPERLYQRFAAELTQRALMVEEALRPTAREGELWQDFSWFTDLPDLSPDGSQLVTVRRAKDGPARLVVFSTSPNTDAEEKWDERIEEMLRRDPDDVAPVRRKPLQRRPKYQLARKSGAVPQTPRWIPGTEHILFVEFVPDRNGFRHPDLFRWNPKTDSVWRLTIEEDLRDADPIGDGAGAIAVRNRYGASQLVQVDFASGEVTPLTEPSILEVYGNPRVSPDETRLAYIAQKDGDWGLVVRELSTGEEVSHRVDGTIAHPEWSPDGSRLYASVGSDGFVEIWEFAAEGIPVDEGRPLTRSTTALFGPAAGQDEIYFLGMDADGVELRRLALDVAAGALPEISLPDSLAPAVRVVPDEVRPTLAQQPLGVARPYGLGPLELSPLFGGAWSASGGAIEVGGRLGDPVGRMDVLALGAIGSDGAASGGVLSGTVNLWPVEIGFSAILAEEQPSRQDFADGRGLRIVDREKTALESELRKVLHWRASTLTIGGGGWWGATKVESGPSLDQWGAFVRAAYEGRPTSGNWTYPQGMSLALSTGATDSRKYTRVVGSLRFGALRKGNGLQVEVGRGDIDDDAHPLDRFEVGGLRTSLHAGTAVFGNRVWAPGLPYGALEGASYTRLRGSVVMSFLPVQAFYERVDTRTGDIDDAIDYAGLEIEMSIEAMPLVRLPGVTISGGVAVAFDEPLDDDVRGWVGLRWRP